MDALPLIENNNLEFKSKNEGIMHACGHDVHMAVQLTLLKILAENKDLWKGSAHFFLSTSRRNYRWS